MNRITLSRWWMLPTVPTPGALLIDGVPFCYTLERRWLDNQRKLSCIPTGMYICERRKNVTLEHVTTPFETFEITNVPGRDGVLFHMGNYEKDSSGCIMVGNNVTGITDISLLSSISALTNLIGKIKGDKCLLEITCYKSPLAQPS